jgi:hypothetical protein
MFMDAAANLLHRKWSFLMALDDAPPLPPVLRREEPHRALPPASSTTSLHLLSC